MKSQNMKFKIGLIREQELQCDMYEIISKIRFWKDGSISGGFKQEKMMMMMMMITAFGATNVPAANNK